jgi:hypothetical protein
VLLAHDRSRLGIVQSPTVQVGTSVGYLLNLARTSADRLDDTQRAEIHRLILRDHAFHTSGRSTGGAAKTARPRGTRPRKPRK